MKKNNKTCIVCGEVYTYCNRCSEYDHLPRWYGIYHDENCKDIFDITSRYLNGFISKEEAKEALSKCDLTKKKNFNKTILDAVNKIMASDRKKKKEIIVEHEESLQQAYMEEENIENN